MLMRNKKLILNFNFKIFNNINDYFRFFANKINLSADNIQTLEKILLKLLKILRYKDKMV